jgi:hypothetical protein
VYLLLKVPLLTASELSLYFDNRQKLQQLLRLQQVQDLEAIIPSRNNQWSLTSKNLPHYLPIFLIIREQKGKMMVRIPNDLPSPNSVKLTSSIVYYVSIFLLLFSMSCFCGCKSDALSLSWKLIFFFCLSYIWLTEFSFWSATGPMSALRFS